MLRRATPLRFDRRATTGRTRPPRVVVATDDDIEHEAFLKSSAMLELGVEGLANEALAAMLAGDVGVPVNEPLLVDLTQDFIESLPDAALQETLTSSAPIAFASVSAGPGWRAWSSGDRVTAERRPAASAILALDALIENDDRRPSNPNLLVKGPELRAIDHEAAFSLRIKVFPKPEPWRLGGLERLRLPDGHVFAGALKAKDLATDDLRAMWIDLDDARLTTYAAVLPPEWAAANEAVDAALTHIANVRDKLDACLAELERALG